MCVRAAKVMKKRGHVLPHTKKALTPIRRGKLQITFHKTSFFLSPSNLLEDYNLTVLVNSGLISEVCNSKICFEGVWRPGVPKIVVYGV